jgi:hypothetical protein
MADPRPYADDDGASAAPDRGSPPRNSLPRTPLWVKMSIIIVGVLILLAVIVKLTGLGGSHGPGRHTGAPSRAPISDTTPPVAPASTPGQHAREGGHR